MRETPRSWLVQLLTTVSSRDAAAAVVGDVLEDLRDRQVNGRAPRWPASWVNVQVLRAIVAALVRRTPRLLRAGALVLRDAWRGLRATPAQALFVVVVLGIGAGAGTVTYSVVDAVLLKPLPVEQPEQLVSISTPGRDYGNDASRDFYWRLHDGLESADGVSVRSTLYGSPITVAGVTDEWPVTRTTAGMFRVMRWSPAIGRFWTDEEHARGERDVAILGYQFWQEQFQGSPSILGETVDLGRRKLRVIGVLPASSDHPELDLTSTPIWTPLTFPRSGLTDSVGSLIARLRPGVTRAQVAEDARRLSGLTDWRPDVRSLHDSYVAGIRTWMLLALGAAGMVVLIACVNTANLLLTRSARRAQEMAVRASLGASRSWIAAVVLTEGVLLSCAASAVALAASVAGVQVAKTAVNTMVPFLFRASAIALNGRVLVAALSMALVTGILVALVPAWQVARAPVAGLLKDAEGTTATGRRRWRSIYLTAEVATTAVLLVVSWLFVVSLIRVVSIDLGIDRTNLVAVHPRIGISGTVAEMQQLVERVPGVRDVAQSTGASPPLVGRGYHGVWVTTTIRPFAAGVSPAGTEPIEVLQYSVTPNYFDVMGLPFRQGRGWTRQVAAETMVVVLDERAAMRLFGTADPLGRQVQAERPAGVFTVAGVVPYVHARGPEDPSDPSVYFALPPNPARTRASLLIRTSRPPAEVMPAIADVLRPIAPPLKEGIVFSADAAVQIITARRRFNAGLMSAFGLVGVLLGAAGVYAVMTSFVAQQTREIGVRMALGASPARVQRGVLRLAGRHLVVGLALGLPVAWWLSRGFTTLLFQVTPADASVYAGVALLLSAVGLLAAWVPARRAARIDPLQSLRR